MEAIADAPISAESTVVEALQGSLQKCDAELAAGSFDGNSDMEVPESRTEPGAQSEPILNLSDSSSDESGEVARVCPVGCACPFCRKFFPEEV